MIKKAVTASVIALFFGSAALFSQTSTWLQNYEKAAALSKKTGKVLLIDFSGTDWCPWCIKLDREVFSQKAFKNYAAKNLVLMLADFPRNKELPAELVKQNEALAKKHGIQGFPTVVLLRPDGKPIAQTGYLEGGPNAYVKHLQELIRKDRARNP